MYLRNSVYILISVFYLLLLNCDKIVNTRIETINHYIYKNEIFITGVTYYHHNISNAQYEQEVLLTGYDNDEVEIYFDDQRLVESNIPGYRRFVGNKKVDFNEEYKYRFKSSILDTAYSLIMPDSNDINDETWIHEGKLNLDLFNRYIDYFIINLYGLQSSDSKFGENYVYIDTTIAEWGHVYRFEDFSLSFLEDYSDVYLFIYGISGRIPDSILPELLNNKYDPEVYYYVCSIIHYNGDFLAFDNVVYKDIIELHKDSKLKFQNFVMGR